jgi:hypothetical protein
MNAHWKRALGLVAIVAMVLFAGGCEKSTEPAADNATQDAAESIASTIGEDNGGILDQLGDVALVCSPGGLQALPMISGGSGSLGKGIAVPDTLFYDDATGYWTIEISRERTALYGLYYAAFSRIYQVQFRNAAGEVQQYYVTGSDTAHSVNFRIVSGTGSARTPRWNHHLREILADWTVTNAHTSILTVNGTYGRSAIDTLLTYNGVRAADHVLSMTMTNITGPRGNRNNISVATSGELAGTYAGTITFVSGETYAERDFTRNFTVTFDNGTAIITVNGRTFTSDLKTGVVTGG